MCRWTDGGSSYRCGSAAWCAGFSIARDLKPVYTAVDEDEARARLTDFDDKWGKRYPSIAGTGERAWSEFVPFLGRPDAIRQVVHTTNAIESLNARCRRAAQACGPGMRPRHADRDEARLRRSPGA